IDPEIQILKEIVFASKYEADSAFNLLNSGIDFDELVMKYSISSTKENKGLLGPINIQNYSKEISEKLSDLEEDEYTKPIPYGEHYIIFKRLKKNNRA
ncbi:MAG: peptidylprolyl isomerase, partial [Ignavibacteriaceae bacterium]